MRSISRRRLLVGLARWHLPGLCIALPILFAIFAYDVAIYWLVPRDGSSLPKVEYRVGRPSQTAEPHQASETSKRSSAKVASPEGAASSVKIEDFPLYLHSRHVAGQFAYATASTFLYVISIVAFSFASWIVWQRLGWKWWFGGCLFWFAVAHFTIFYNLPMDLVRPLLVDDILKAVVGFDFQKGASPPLDLSGSVLQLTRFNEYVFLIAADLQLMALAALSPRMAKKALTVPNLQRRLILLRYTLGFSSALLAMMVIALKVLVEWPLTLIDSSQAMALKPVVGSTILFAGSAATLFLFTACLPAIASWEIDVYRLKRSGMVTSDASNGALAIAPMSVVTGIVSIVAPLIASPVLDVLKTALGAVVGN